MAKLFESVK